MWAAARTATNKTFWNTIAARVEISRRSDYKNPQNPTKPEYWYPVYMVFFIGHIRAYSDHML